MIIRVNFTQGKPIVTVISENFSKEYISTLSAVLMMSYNLRKKGWNILTLEDNDTVYGVVMTK